RSNAAGSRPACTCTTVCTGNCPSCDPIPLVPSPCGGGPGWGVRIGHEVASIPHPPPRPSPTRGEGENKPALPPEWGSKKENPTMPDPSQPRTPSVSEILLRWEELRERGQTLTAEELCREYPELREEVARRIQALLALEPVLDDSTQPTLLR